MAQQFTKTQLICMGVCCAVISNVVNIVAVVISFNEYEHSSCVSDDVCSEECNPDAMMDVSLYLQVAGFSMMGLTLLSLCTQYLIFPPPDGNYQSASGPQIVISLLIVCYEIVWAIIGLVIDAEAIEGCRESPKGQMLLAWAIIYLIAGICGCCSLCMVVKARQTQ
eukprot:230924_1